jgi:hypothetical protein
MNIHNKNHDRTITNILQEKVPLCLQILIDRFPSRLNLFALKLSINLLTILW